MLRTNILYHFLESSGGKIISIFMIRRENHACGRHAGFRVYHGLLPDPFRQLQGNQQLV
jgi:hypothetical protein